MRPGVRIRTPAFESGHPDRSGWRPEPESNRRARICSPLRNHSAIGPKRKRGNGRAANACQPAVQARTAHSSGGIFDRRRSRALGLGGRGRYARPLRAACGVAQDRLASLVYYWHITVDGFRGFDDAALAGLRSRPARHDRQPAAPAGRQRPGRARRHGLRPARGVRARKRCVRSPIPTARSTLATARR